MKIGRAMWMSAWRGVRSRGMVLTEDSISDFVWGHTRRIVWRVERIIWDGIAENIKEIVQE